MKTLRVCGWAVIFTVTLLLAACATHTSEVADTDMMSGPDATMIQPVEKQTLERWENALVIRQAWLDERESQLDQREAILDLRENAVAISRAWLDERETRLDQMESGVEMQENALVINRAWLSEREKRLAQGAPDMTLTASSVKLAGADYLPVATETLVTADMPRTRVEGGRCFATVVYPAEYKTVTVTKPIESPQGENLPVLYKTVTEKVKVTDEQTRWTEILCDNDMSECRISEIQRALYRGGYNPGPIDGVVGRQTMAAVNAFQKDFNLTVADYLTVETVRALDANF